MPPALSDGEESSSSEIEIPASKPKKPEPAETDKQEEDEEEEEYELECIRGHDVKKGGRLLFEVKWKGYDDADNTWETESNLMESASEVLTDYFEMNGGKEMILRGKGKAKGKRKTEDLEPVSKRGKRSKVADVAASRSAEWTPPKGSWEAEITSVENVEELEEPKTGALERYAFVRWNNGRLTKHPLRVMRQKAPQKMCDFFENHLVFKTASRVPVSNGALVAPGEQSEANDTLMQVEEGDA